MTKDNWIKAFDELFYHEWNNEMDDGCQSVIHKEKSCDCQLADIKSFISQVEKDAIEKRTKLLEDSFKHRTKPVVNLDDEDKNCEVCGYDHDSMTEANENAYKVAHLKVELSQAIEKTNKRWYSMLSKKTKTVTYHYDNGIGLAVPFAEVNKISDLLNTKGE